MPSTNEFIVRDSGARQDFETGARRDDDDTKPKLSLLPPAPLTRIAWVYTRGAKKYGPHNWQKGMPYSRYLDSALRHIFAWMRGDAAEDHLAMACWNLMAIMHHQEVGPAGLDDMTGSFSPEGNALNQQAQDEFTRAQAQAVRPEVLVDRP